MADSSEPALPPKGEDTGTSNSGFKPITSKELPSLETLVGRNWVTLREFCKIIGCTYQTGQRYITSRGPHDGKPARSAVIRAIKLGGQWRINETDLRTFLDSGNQLTPENDPDKQWHAH